jgi:hypothetical protein
MIKKIIIIVIYGLSGLFLWYSIVTFFDSEYGFDDSIFGFILAAICFSCAWMLGKKKKVITNTNHNEFISNEKIPSEFQRKDGMLFRDDDTAKYIKSQFATKYDLSVRVYNKKRFAKDDMTIKEIKLFESDIPGSYFSVNGDMKVGDVEKRFNELFGVRIQIEEPNGELADDNSIISKNFIHKEGEIQEKSVSQHVDINQNIDGGNEEMAKELKVDGRMKVGNFKNKFKDTFDVGIRIYKGKQFAPDDATLSSIRSENAKGGKIQIHGRTKVGNIEKMFQEEMGIKIQIEDKTGGLADNNISITQAGK